MKKFFYLTTALLFSLGGAAQNTYTIYPVPQSKIEAASCATFTDVVNVVCEEGIDAATQSRARSILEEHGLSVVFSAAASGSYSNLYLGINGSGGLADSRVTALGLDRSVFAEAGKYDRHLLHLAPEKCVAEVLIVGEHTDAAFFGLASLEQMLDYGVANLPSVTIYDYADMQSRGIVEGYYGYPYSVSVKKDLMRFMMRYKMNTYLYGAKSDPYHSEHWQSAYPMSITSVQETNGWLSQQMIREIAQESQNTKVNFIWAIHPGNNFLGSSTVVNDIMNKFTLMYNLGVRQFAVFVDDVSIPSNAEGYALNASRVTALQKEMENKWNKTYASPADTVRPLHFVPQIYCRAFAGSQEQFTDFFNALAATPSYVTVYTTGYGVWSVPNTNDYKLTATPLQRNVGWWWNYPCNDNADSQIYPMDMYSNFYDMPAVNSSATLPSSLDGGTAIVCNPMQEGELSKIPIFSVADYAWNTSGFVNQKSWQAAVKAVVGTDREAAFRFLANYLRWNDPEDVSAMITEYKSKGSPERLQERMQQILAASQVVATLETSSNESDRLLYKDLRPWLLKIQKMASTVQAFLRTAEGEKGSEEQWNTYLQAMHDADSLGSSKLYEVKALEGMGSGISVSTHNAKASQRYLNDFISYLKENVLTFDSKRLSKPIAITNSSAGAKLTVSHLTSTGTTSLVTTTTIALGKDEYIGVQLVDAVRLTSLTLNASFFDTFNILYSENGKVWNRLTAGETPTGYVKYIVIQNPNDAEQPLRTNARTFSMTQLTPPTVTAVGTPTGSDAESTTKASITDGDYSTFYAVNKNQANNDVYQLTLSRVQPIYDVRVCVGLKNDDYMNSAVVEISSDNTVWAALPIKGTSSTNFTRSAPQVVNYSAQMFYCDFDGNGANAKYVRLRITNAKTNKWLRLYEMEVNKQTVLENTKAVIQDGVETVLTSAFDGKAYTAAQNVRSAITYHFLEPSELRGVKFYIDPATVSDAEVFITEDGSSWQLLGNLNGALVAYDLSAYPRAVALRVNWQNVAPVIHEIVEETAQTSLPIVVTGIRQIEGNATEMELRVEGNRLQIKEGEQLSAIHLYTVDGCKVVDARLSGEKTFCLPLPENVAGSVVARLFLLDGTSIAYKLQLR